MSYQQSPSPVEAVWPEVVVDEHNIQVHISVLRKALRDEAGWDATVPRLGYRFAGPIARATGMGPRPADPPRPLTRLFGRESDLPGSVRGGG
jgi:DNA-binding winged helix-turn-helix (wHTH) protein